MPEYDNSLRGALFLNERKDSDKHPDYKGSIEDDNGREFWVSAWIKTSAKGSKYLSLALTPKDDAPSSAPRPQSRNSDAADFLNQNRDKADKHKPKNVLSGPSQPRQPDFDPDDSDIPF